MIIIILTAALMLTGIVAGMYACTVIHDYRINELSAAEYMAMHQMRDKTFRVVMPPLRLVNLALVAAASFVIPAGLPKALAISSAVLIVIDIVLTTKLQVPLNREIQSWTASTIPAHWAEIRDRWAARHNIRVLLDLVSFLCVVAASVLAIAHF